MDIPYLIKLCTIDMPERKMPQQIAESKYAKLLFQEVGTHGANAFQIIDGGVKYLAIQGLLSGFNGYNRDLNVNILRQSRNLNGFAGRIWGA